MSFFSISETITKDSVSNPCFLALCDIDSLHGYSTRAFESAISGSSNRLFSLVVKATRTISNFMLRTDDSVCSVIG